MLSIMIAAMGLLSFEVKAQDNMPDIKSWPEASQMAAKEMMDKYGKPNETTPHKLVWNNNGPGKKPLSMTWKPSIYSQLTTLM